MASRHTGVTRAVLLILCLAGSFHAAVVPRLSLEELVQESEVIVHGRVLESWSGWDSGRRYIWTHHRVEILDPLKGATGQTVVVSEPGGSADGINMQISGGVKFAVGEEVVVFLYRTPIGFFRTSGYWQGKYSIAGAPQAGEKRIRTNVAGMTLVEPAGSAIRQQTSLRTLDGLTLNDFKAKVREMVGRYLLQGRN